MNLKRLPLIVFLLLSLACNVLAKGSGGRSSTLVPGRTVEPVATPTTAVYVPPDCQGEPIATLPPATTLAEPTPSLGTNPTLNTAEQLKVFDALAKKIAAVYVYPDFNGQDWPSIVKDYRAQVEGGLDTETFYAEMENFISDLGDEHSNFESPVQVAASNASLAGTSNYVGIGVLVKPLIEKETMTILVVSPDSPAAHSGLRPHDSILAIDGLPLVEAGQPYPHRLRGPKCSTLVATIQSPSESPRTVTLMRYPFTGSLPIEARRVPTTDGSRLGYIFLPTFFDQTVTEQVKQALEAFGALDGLILDNRMNGGGSSTVFKPILGYFTSGVLGNFVSRAATQPLEITADPIENSETVPLVVLVGQDTVSFGEIFSGVLQDTGRAKLVGQKTLGNVETLHGYTFEDGSRAWIAEERFDPLVSHADWEKDGLQPEVEAYAEWDTFTFEDDPGIAAAVALLGHQ